MKTSQLLVVALVGVLLFGAGLYVGKGLAPLYLGSGSGQDHFNLETFHVGLHAENFLSRGTVVTQTAGATTTVAASDFCKAATINWAPSATTASWTLPHATSVVAVVDCLPEDGDSLFPIKLRNTSATFTAVVGSGVGNVLLEPDGQNVVIDGGNFALLHVQRISSTTLEIIVDEVIDAD